MPLQDQTLATLLNQSVKQLKTAALDNIDAIQRITQGARILAMNALIEAEHAGRKGAGFSAVASEVKTMADEIEKIAVSLGSGLNNRVDELRKAVIRFTADAKSNRLVDLALNAVEIIDRNLYERTCDVRWWATDGSVVDCARDPIPTARDRAEERLGVILSSYTVYLDLWLCRLDGTIIANGRPERFDVRGKSVTSMPWFQMGCTLPSSEAYAVADISDCDALKNERVATYVAQVRESGSSRGEPVGLLAIHFDWTPQARAVVEGIRLSPDEASRSRVMLLDASQRVIASSDGIGILKERFPLRAMDRTGGGSYVDDGGRLVAYHTSPGYETYRGLGWCGVIVQTPE